MSRVRKFPLVADSEPVLQMAKTMHLYENEDLITNIQGPYQDKAYNDVTQGYQFLEDNPEQSDLVQERLQSQTAGKSYAEMAREEAKRDLKKKRQSFAQTRDVSKHLAQPSAQVKKQRPARALKDSVTTELSRFSDNLKQDTYILAEMPTNYQQPQNNRDQHPKKNNYDFLKHSQIYNRKEEQEERERHLAQELNLTRFDDDRT